VSVRAILVTGGAGFIGSHTCKRLAQEGFLPVAYDNLRTGRAAAVKWGPLILGDVLDTDTLTAALAQYEPAALIHFAASAYVGESVAEPAWYYRNNVVGMLSALDACRAVGVENFIFSSSCATYGIPDMLPIHEDMAQNPINPYGRTKLIGEQMLEDFSEAYGLNYVALRYFNACGADPEGDLAERHDPETHLIPNALLAASGRIGVLRIFGNDYDTVDGTCVRDYVHVSDLARAHVLATRHLLAGGANLKVNLGTGLGASIYEVLDAVTRITNCPVPVTVLARRAGDPPALYADSRLASETLGFTAELSDLDTIVRTAAPTFGFGAGP
jgi:UDP-arabinose 4-epimerase